MVRLLEDSVNTLEETCLDVVCNHVSAYLGCDAPLGPKGEKTGKIASQPAVTLFGDAGPLPSGISDKVFEIFSRNGNLNATTVRAFNKDSFWLRNVSLRGSSLTPTDLQVLKEHELASLELVDMPHVSVAGLLDSVVSTKSVSSLVRLNLSKTIVADEDYEMENMRSVVQPRSVRELSRLVNLRSLNISYARSVRDTDLDHLSINLRHLESLNISNCPFRRITGLTHRQSTLRQLNMSQLALEDYQSTSDTLKSLLKLETLDLSVLPDGPLTTLNSPVSLEKILGAQLLSEPGFTLPRLWAIDVSGCMASFDVNLMCHFLKRHRKLQFLGLLQTNACYFDIFLPGEEEEEADFVVGLQISGEASRTQIVTALRTYWNREGFCAKALFHLYTALHSNFESFTAEDIVDCLKNIIRSMDCHLPFVNVQMAGTACLYNFCRNERCTKLPPRILKHVVDASMCAVETHRGAEMLQLHKNVWLTLCSDSVLNCPLLDQFRCCRNALESLTVYNADPAITRMTVAIVSILAAKIPTERTTLLGVNENYMTNLLDIITRRVRTAEEVVAAQLEADPEQAAVDPPPDVTLKFTLSALWNLTDESPDTCRCFLASDGLMIVMKVVQIFHDSSVETKVLGLLNNVAEVKSIKGQLTDGAVLEKICDLLQSPKIDVSYFAAGILAHLCCDENWGHHPSSFRCESLLFDVVNKWAEPESDMVAYRSFKPFFPLLHKFGSHGVQMWAVWAIRHVCTKNRSRYVPMFLSENGKRVIEQIIRSDVCDGDVVKIACEILALTQAANDAEDGACRA